MADKPAKKPEGGGGGTSFESEAIFIGVIAVVVLLIVLPTVLKFLGFRGSDGNGSIIPTNFFDRLNNAFEGFVDTIGFICIFISLMFLMALIYAKVRYAEVMKEYEARQKALENIGKGEGQFVPGMFKTSGPELPGAVEVGADGSGVGLGSNVIGDSSGTAAHSHGPLKITNPKWIEIERHMQSSNQSEWRVAILEADILLYDMLTQMGYEGDSIGEILKKVDPANFITLQDAWKAHLIRNNIAHGGASFELTREEADRAIRLFKRVFDEFYFV